MLTQYAKSIAAILAAALAVLVTGLTDGVLTPLELVTLAIAVVTAVGVYLVPNLDSGPQRYAKGVVAFLGAGLAALAVILSGALGWVDVSLSSWLSVILAALGGIGVVVVPNAPLTPAVVGADGVPDISSLPTLTLATASNGVNARQNPSAAATFVPTLPTGGDPTS